MTDKERLRNIRIIVSDLDGTLLLDDGSIGEKTKNVIRELHNYGVLFSFATGRLHSAVTGIARELDINNPIISLDGCLIKDFPEDKTIYESFIKEKYVRKAIKHAENYLLYIALCHSDAIYFTESNSVVPQLINKFGAKFEEVDSYENYLNKTLEIVFIGDNKEYIEFVQDKFIFPYAFGCSTSYFKSHSHRGMYNLDIRRTGSSKGKGLKRLLKYLKIKESQAVVMGDWYNDISMFESKAIKVAVANSIPEIVRIADHVTKKSNNDEGAVEFFEMILNAKKD